VKGLFRSAVARLWSVMSASSYNLPPLVIGLTDIKRLHLIRVAAAADPFVSATSDGIAYHMLSTIALRLIYSAPHVCCL
jgi:hypothetical protein